MEHISLLTNGLEGKTSTSLKEIYEKWAKLDVNSKYVSDLIECLVRSRTAVCTTLIVTKMDLFPSSEYSRYMRVLFPLSKKYKNNKPKTRFGKINIVDRKKAFNNMLKLINKLKNKGVRLIAGTDTASPFVAPGFSLHQELKLLVDSGFTPIEALRTATSEAAKILGDYEIGQIKPGLKANMVLLSKDAESNINNIDTMTHVVLNDEVIGVNRRYLLSRSTLKKFALRKTKR